jgi:hypothetical protein
LFLPSEWNWSTNIEGGKKCDFQNVIVFVFVM